jgi:hypothetical protein
MAFGAMLGVEGSSTKRYIQTFIFVFERRSCSNYQILFNFGKLESTSFDLKYFCLWGTMILDGGVMQL